MLDGAGGAGSGRQLAADGVPQYPQNLLPRGKDLWHFGHITWATAGATGGAGVGAGGGAGAGGCPMYAAFRSARRRAPTPGSCFRRKVQRDVTYGSLFVCVSGHILCSSRFSPALFAGGFNPNGVSIAAKFVIGAVSCAGHQPDIPPIR